MTSESTPPDAQAAVDAAERLTAQLTALLADNPRPADQAELTALAGQLVTVTERLLWARDAALHAARRGGAHWRQLTEVSGVADSTLSERERAWLRRRRVPPAPLVTRSD